MNKTVIAITMTFCLILLSCGNRLTSPDEDELAYSFEVGKGWVISEKGENEIFVRSSLFGDRNVYYNNKEKIFLFAWCWADCNERIKQNEWSLDDDGDYHAFLLIDEYNDKTNRLLLFNFKDEVTTELNIKDTEIDSFVFTDSTFVYTEASGDEVTIELE